MTTAIALQSNNLWMGPLSSANNIDCLLNVDVNPIEKSEVPRSTGLTSALLQSLSNYQKSNLSSDKSNVSFATHILKLNLAGIDAQLTHPDIKDEQQLSGEIKDIAISYNEKCAKAGLSQFAISDGKKDIAGQIGDIIGKVKEDYYDVFEESLAKYIKFYKELSDITSKMSEYIHSVKDEGQLKYDFVKLRDKLYDLAKNYSDIKDKVLYPNSLANIDKISLSQDEAERWAKDMGLPASCAVKNTTSSAWCVVIDTSPLNNMAGNIIHNEDGYQLYNTEYQAWLTGFNAQEDQMKTTVQSLTGRFGNANAVYDNMVKVLSSTISTLAEMFKRYFSF